MLFSKVNRSIETWVLLVTFFGVAIILIQFNHSFGLQYSNYTSDKYKIQFQYPSDWQLKEKMSRFDEGTDIQINSPTISGGFILAQYLNESMADFRSAFYDTFKGSISDYKYDYKVIEQPSFTKIANQETGTYLYTRKDNSEDYATKWAVQVWLVNLRDRGYLISFSSTADVFDSLETTEARNHFVKSINFLDIGNMTLSTSPSRFD